MSLTSCNFMCFTHYFVHTFDHIFHNFVKGSMFNIKCYKMKMKKCLFLYICYQIAVYNLLKSMHSHIAFSILTLFRFIVNTKCNEILILVFYIRIS